MAFWIAIAVLTAAASIALLAPLFRARLGAADKDAAIAIYRDQLGEIERDLDRGVLVETEAKAARTEIARRLLQAEDDPERGRSASRRLRDAAIVVVLVLIPAAALGGYLYWGEPNRGDLPVAGRLDGADDADPVARIATLEEELAASPDDAALWEEALNLYLTLGDGTNAAAAYIETVRLNGAAADPTGNLGTNLGFALLQSGDPINAVMVLTTAARAAPANPDPRYLIASTLTGLGLIDEAILAWQEVLTLAPDGEFADIARQQLAALEAEQAAPQEPAVDPGAVAAMTAEEQAAFIEQMVAGLAERLAAEPDDPEGWADLIRSYIVLGRTGEARAALEDARAALEGDEAALAVVEEAAQPLEQTE
ncbi:MAG: c-type cytochrome biogenesis protein CcmI [Bauldia sp.]|nr:c-type cytochrome biogenesis protein CcmI [Bauldia sp.]